VIENPAIAVILPARDEEAALAPVLAELLPHAARHGAIVAVGLNDCRDRSRAVAEAHGVIVGETKPRGYGHGCLAAIAAVHAADLQPDAYIFMAADGAHDPAELPRLLDPWRAGARLVLGQRTSIAANWPRLGFARATFNVLLGAWAGVLSGKFYRDLGPFRLIDRQLFERIAAQETAWGWTIEPQVVAPRLGVRAVEVSVTERPRIAGEQKVTGVSLGHTLRIGLEIIRAGWRSRTRELPQPSPKLAAPEERTSV
jgi:glycosyltransferase involved in cell wall biosynthesis